MLLLLGAISVVRATTHKPGDENFSHLFITADDSTSSPQQFTSGKLNRHARAAQQRTLMVKSTVPSPEKSRFRLDSAFYAHRDSSARIAQFKYVRKDEPVADGVYHKTYPLFLSDPPVIRYRDDLDSTRWVYRLRRMIGEDDIRIPIDVPLEEYTTLRLKNSERKNWESLAQTYQLKEEKKEGLAEVMGKVTNIEIPVPKNPLFSIFGPNIIRLQINGGVDIHAAFRNTKSDLFVANPLGQSRNEPDFKQEVQVTVKGEIGDKLKVDADWNTQRTFDYENQLHVNYKGYEDEIVQSVEAGNVSLQTNSSFISSSQALFGIKAGFQFGPLKLTTIATQKKGQIKELTASGGSTSAPFSKRVNEYSHDHYFIDTSYIGIYEDLFYTIPAVAHLDKQVLDIEVWVSRSGQVVPTKERKVIAFMNPDSIARYQNNRPSILQPYGSDGKGEMEAGSFIPLSPKVDYEFNADAGILTLKTQVQQDQVIAVAYTLRDRTVGNFGASTPLDSNWLIMKLVRPKYLETNPTTMVTAWNMMIKNRYPVSGGGLSKDNFKLNIEYDLPSQPPATSVFSENYNLLGLFGLDRYNADNTLGHDNVFDYISNITIDEEKGEIIFPTLKPFGRESIKKFLRELGMTDPNRINQYADSLQFDKLYDTTTTGADRDQHNLFLITGTSTSTVQSQYQLGFNIVEGSVQVLVDGQPATPNADYTVDYLSGTVNIRNTSFLVPGRNIQIKYEANDLFQLASKTLIGARSELDLGRSSSLGFTIMNLNQQSLSDKVRLGEEPLNNTIMGVDGGTTFNMPLLTDALNLLPGIHTTANSEISVRGEYAYMSPNPNTRTSPLTEDGGAGVAYIDDFEGSRQIIPIGVSYTAWKEASPPYYVPGLDSYIVGYDKSIPTTRDPGIKIDTEKINYKGHAIWFNVLQSDVLAKQIWPRRNDDSGQEQVPVLNFYFNPKERGAYNYSMNLDSILNYEKEKTWGGAQTVLGTTTTNLVDQNIAFIEMWVKVVASQPHAKLNIDLGYISEDVIPNGILNTEDGLDNPAHIPNGILNPQVEDVGLDELSDAQEKVTYRTFWEHYSTTHPEYEDDPSGDDWKQPPLSINGQALDVNIAKTFKGCNGTEGSSGSELGSRFPDTEDLNNNNNLDKTNSYFEYELPLNTTDTAFTKYVSGQGDNGWLLVRIPLQEFARQIGSPTLTNVEGMRLWVTGASDEVLFRIAELDLVGNQWEKKVRDDQSFEVSVVSYYDNPSYAVNSPVPLQRDLTQPTKKVYNNEQSLNLIIHNLHPGDSREVIKYYTSRPLDVFSYHTMKMLVHGETGDISKGYSAFDNGVQFYFRFGSDSLNYYEYRAPVKPAWYGNEMIIHFSELTVLKTLQRDSLNRASMPVSGGPAGSRYAIRGEPSLTSIKYMGIGIENHKTGDSTLNGELWVNELRLTDVDNTPGWAYKIDTKITFADVANVAFSMNQRNPNFHSLEDHFGNRVDARSWNLTTGINFERFLPESWNGTTLGFTYSHSENYNKPQYMPGTDILVDAAANKVAEQAAQGLIPDTLVNGLRRDRTADDVHKRSEDLSVTDNYSLSSIKFNVPFDTWLITKTINQIRLAYSYNSSYRRSPTQEWAKAWGWNFNAGYSIPFDQNNYLELLWKDLKIYFTPRSFNVSATLNRSRSEDRTRGQDKNNAVVRNLTAQRSLAFGWQFFEGKHLALGLDYQLSVSSTLIQLETDEYGNQRSFSDILSKIFFNDGLINFGIDQQYAQTITFNNKISFPEFLSLNKIFTPSFQYSSRYSWADNTAAKELGKSAGWNTSPSFSLDVSLKPISESIWSPSGSTQAPVSQDTSSGKKSKKTSEELSYFTRLLFKNLLFDFESFNINFSQSNTVQNSGVIGATGFGNLFTRVPFLQSSLNDNGPSLYYQLGLSSDPSGTLVIKPKGSFPFITGYTEPGLRAPNGQLTDVFSQSNTVALKTGRTLWEGARLDFNWRISWSYNQTRSIRTDGNGIIDSSQTAQSISGTTDRTFLTFPQVFIFKLFNTGIENVSNKFNAMKNDDNDTRPIEQKLSQAFVNGFEAMPFLSKLFGQFAPRVNWSFHWSGLEKYFLFSWFASSVSFDHAYNSSYQERWHLTPQTIQSPEGSRVTDGQGISYGFAPLAGLNIQFNPLFKGTMSTTIRYNATTSYDLSLSNQNVLQGDQSDVSLNVTYSRQGFEIPFFGLSLSNDVDLSFSYSYGSTSRLLYDFKDFNKNGIPQDGSTHTTMQPRIRYVLSARLTASLYYSYTKTSPATGGSKIPGSTTNEGGLDIHIAIQ